MKTQPNGGPEPRPMSMKPSKLEKMTLGPFLRCRSNESTRLQSLKKQRTFRNDAEGSG
jgi:hypothetical protein